jgi:hypothetical protein
MTQTSIFDRPSPDALFKKDSQNYLLYQRLPPTGGRTQTRPHSRRCPY